MNNYFVVYKPFNVLSQFSQEGNKQTLKEFFNVPVDVYSIGRLDYDSEGLLILTNDKFLNKELLHPLHSHEREYWVQVEGSITEEAIKQLQKGVTINTDGKLYITRPCRVEVLSDPYVPTRVPPIRYRKNIPDSWISIVLTEGKNRQVRKMTASVGFPTLRLIRYRIEKVTIERLQPGEMKILSQGEMYTLLKINKQ